MGYIEVRLTNCTANVVEGEYNPGQTINILVTCDSNYEFQVEPYIEWEYISSSGRWMHGIYHMNKVDDTTYSYDLAVQANPDYYIIGEAVKKSIILDKYGLITVYRVTTDELKQISRKRFIELSGGNGNYSVGYIDTAQYLVSLIKVYVSLETDTKQELYFGPYDMDIECDVLGEDVITLDLGSVHISEIYGNTIDYENTEISAYLPFIGFVTLPVGDFMNKDVSLHYQINIVNGDALAVFTCNNEVMFSQSCNVSFKVPYQLKGAELIEKEVQPNTNYLLDTPATIYVKTHNIVDNSTLPYHDTKFYSRFGDLTGYTEAEEIDFTVLSEHITKTEIDEIIQLLENGVFL